MGGTVPKEYYFSNHAKFDPTNKKSLTVGSGSKEHLEYQVTDRISAIWYVNISATLKIKMKSKPVK